MKIGLKGENLIFLLSQPRAGSTLLQQILKGNDKIHTMPEPWILLPPLFSYYKRRMNKYYRADYNPFFARHGINDFINRLPAGEEDYLEGLRRMHAYLYERAIEGSGAQYFLDKAPRYYLVFPELCKLFPEASYIVLFRNPLAVLCSTITTWVKTERAELQEFKYDLLRAPRMLAEGANLAGQRCLVLRYEDLLKDPEGEARKACERLKIQFQPEMLNYKFREADKSALGYVDQKEEYKQGSADEQNIDRWVSRLNDPQIWRFSRDYLEYLGPELVDKMGYSYADLNELLGKHYCGRPRLLGTTSLLAAIKKSEIRMLLRLTEDERLERLLKRQTVSP